MASILSDVVSASEVFVHCIVIHMCTCTLHEVPTLEIVNNAVLCLRLADSLKGFKHKATNKPQETPGITQCATEISDLERWQPLCVPTSFIPNKPAETCEVRMMSTHLLVEPGFMMTNAIRMEKGRPGVHRGSRSLVCFDDE